MYIDGSWCDAISGSRMEARSPVHDEVIGTVPEGGAKDVDLAMEAARGAQPQLEAMDIDQRAKMAMRVSDLIRASADELAQVLTLDQGKPMYSEAVAEVERAADSWHQAGEVLQWTETHVYPIGSPDRRLIYTIRQAKGVYGMVTPFNVPIGLPQLYLPFCFVGGNAMVWCPAPTTSWCSLKFAEILEQAELPAGAVNVVTGCGPVVGDAIMSHPGTDAIVFVGSNATGQIVAERAAGKPQILELGGNGPTIVLDDVDVEQAASTIAMGCFKNAGQICTATERILSEPRIHKDLVEAMTQKAKSVCLGDPFARSTTMGPLNNIGGVEKMDRHIADAVAKGARLLLGGRNEPDLGSDMYYQPTVIDGFAIDSLLNQEETFGPMVKIRRCANEEETIQVADSCRYGLAAAVFTNDLDRAMRLSRRVKAGLVHINENTCQWTPRMPAGGFTGAGSGIGRIGGKETYRQMTNEKTVSISWL